MSLLARVWVPLSWLIAGLFAAWEAIDGLLVRAGDLFGVRIANPLWRYLVLQGIFLGIFLVGVLPIPVLPLLVLIYGYIGVLGVGRAWVRNEKERLAIAKKVVAGDPDRLPDQRWVALLSALQLLVLFPLLFNQVNRNFHFYKVADDANLMTWMVFTLDSYNKAILGVVQLYGIEHHQIEFVPGAHWGRHLVLISRVTFDLLLIQGILRLFAIRESIRDAVTAIIRDPSLTLAVGRRTVPSLIGCLKTGDPVVRTRAAEVLGMFGDPRAEEPLIEALVSDKDAGVRSAAARSLGRMEARQARQALLKALQDPMPEVGAAAAGALGHLGEAGETVEALLVALRDRDGDKRANAAHALAELGDDRVVEPLLEVVLHDTEAKVRSRVIESLKVRWADLTTDRLIAQLQQPRNESMLGRLFRRKPKAEQEQQVWLRKQAAEALGHLGEKRSVDALVGALRDEDRLVRRSALEALGKLAEPRALEPILGMLRDRERDVRIQTAKTLALLDQEKAVEPLLAAWKKESDGEVRLHIGQAVQRLNPQAAEVAGIS